MIIDSADGCIIHLWVQPSAPKSQIIGPHDGALKIKIKAPPVEGKANSEIIRFFSEILKTPKKNIEILRGELGRRKSILVANKTAAEVSAAISALASEA
jgi:uncharacterized protein